MKAKVIRENCIGLSKVINAEVKADDEEDFKDALDSCPTAAIVEDKE